MLDMWVVYCGRVRGEVGTRSRMCYVGWVPTPPIHPSYITHARSHTHFTSYPPTVYNPHVEHSCLLSFFFISQPEDDQCKVPKHVVVLYVINSIHISTIIHLCQTNTYTPIQYNYKHNGDDEPYDMNTGFVNVNLKSLFLEPCF